MAGSPFIGAAALGGTTEFGEEMAIVAFEQPEVVPGFDDLVSRDVLERLHLEKYRFDHVLRRGVAPFEDVQRGADPPDFMVVTMAGDVRLDCVALAVQHRRRAYDLFSSLSERLSAGAEGRDLSGLAGTAVSVSFGEQMDETPPSKSDDSLVDPLLDLLADTAVDREAYRAHLAEMAKGGGFPAQLQPGVVTHRTTPDGKVGFVANIVCEPEEAVQAFGELGFTVALHMPQPLTFTDIRTELERIVDKHDKPEIETLLVTAGGPDRDGIRYPVEELVAWQLAEGGSLEVKADHLKQMTLHLWGMCRIHDVTVVPRN